uniref:Putative secreted salivary protein n=1 Tax=Ixodes scapularis TaxID=6945 RepID=Q4PN54_IXOSC|nr:putative secreted salivary protein [Ixodes scapularis]
MAPPSVVVVGLCYRLASLLPPLPSFRSREGGSLTPGS